MATSTPRSETKGATLGELIEQQNVGPAPLFFAKPAGKAKTMRKVVVVEKAPKVRPRIAKKKTAQVAEQPAPKTADKTRDKSSHRFQGDVIIVVPKSKMKPLFTPEGYKRRNLLKGF
jgi:hypothetical protein